MTFHTPHSFRIPARLVIGTSESIAVTETGAPFLIECMVKEGQSFSRY